jgi:HEAT repeat protein
VAENSGVAGTVRRDALRAAAALADARALPRLVALTRQSDPTLALLATWGIARVRSPESVATLVRILESREHPADTRAMAALGLTGVRTPVARAALLRALDGAVGAFQPGSQDVRAGEMRPSGEPVFVASVVWALGSWGDASLAPRFRSLMTATFWPHASAVAALGMLPGAPRAEVLSDLAVAMFSPARPSAGSGTLALHRVAARALVRLAGQGDDPFARVFNDPMAAASTEEMLRRLLDPPGSALDGAVAFTRFVTPITRAAREALDFPEGRDRVLDALGERGLVAPLVTTRAAADRPEVRRAYESFTRDLVATLAAQASHTDAAVRRKVLGVLVHIDAPAATEALARATTDRDPQVSELALRALVERGERGATGAAPEAVAQRLAETTPWAMRRAAAEVLGRSDGSDALDALTRALEHDPYAFVREAAARALGRRASDPTARAALERAAREDADEVVRQAARAALEGRSE